MGIWLITLPAWWSAADDVDDAAAVDVDMGRAPDAAAPAADVCRWWCECLFGCDDVERAEAGGACCLKAARKEERKKLGRCDDGIVAVVDVISSSPRFWFWC